MGAESDWDQWFDLKIISWHEKYEIAKRWQ
jgi:RNA polymerase subunit RPABC4/transcription elongation factor Spt4